MSQIIHSHFRFSRLFLLIALTLVFLLSLNCLIEHIECSPVVTVVTTVPTVATQEEEEFNRVLLKLKNRNFRGTQDQDGIEEKLRELNEKRDKAEEKEEEEAENDVHHEQPDDNKVDDNANATQLFDHCSAPIGLNSINLDIIGGKQIRPHEFPWQVSLYTTYSDQVKPNWLICGGVILTSEWILTTAHCFYPLDELNGTIVVKVGQHEKFLDSSMTQTPTVLHSVLHEKFVYPNHEWDIAMIKVMPMKLNRAVWPICLPSTNYDFPSGTSCTVVGFPINSEDVNDKKVAYHQIEIPLISHEVCNRPQYHNNSVSKTMICAGVGGKDACDGDSGRALMCPMDDKWIAYGLVSWGIGCGLERKPGVYTKISSHIDWIIKHVTGKYDCKGHNVRYPSPS